jgi:hypothetical protein
MLKSMWVGGPTIMNINNINNAIAAGTDSSLKARLASIERMEAETDRLAAFQKEVMRRLLLLNGTELGTVAPEWKWDLTPTLKVSMLYLCKEVEIKFTEYAIILTDISSDEELDYVIDRSAYSGNYMFNPEKSEYIDGKTPSAILALLDELEKMAGEIFSGEHFVLPVELRSDDCVIGTNGPEIWFESADQTEIIAENMLGAISWYDTSFVPDEMITALKKFIED